MPVISVIGLGYVGVVSVGCLAARGFTVVGADLDPAKVAAVAGGVSPIVEARLDELLAEGVRQSKVRATTDVAAAVQFLLGDGARNITGTTLTVDAGNTA